MKLIGFVLLFLLAVGSGIQIHAQTASPPVITEQPTEQPYIPFPVDLGANFTLSVTATGSLPMFYQWQRDGLPIPHATATNLVLTSIQVDAQGFYQVVVSNAFGAVTSVVARLVVRLPGGTVHFANLGGGIMAPVFDVDGMTALAGQDFLAQLYAGVDTNSLVAAGSAIAFSTQGWFLGSDTTLTNLSADGDAFVQVRVWQSAKGTTFEQALAAGSKVGMSAIIQVRPTAWSDPALPGAFMFGLQSFHLVGLSKASLPQVQILSQTPMLRIHSLADGTIQVRMLPNAHPDYRLEVSSDLGDWVDSVTLTNLTAQVPFTDTNAPSFSRRFYRLVTP